MALTLPPGLCGREQAPDSAPQRLSRRGPRGPWAAEGLESTPARVGEGVLQLGSPFLQLIAWESDCSRGPRKNSGFRVSRPPQLVGRDRGGSPCWPRSVGSGSCSDLRVVEEVLPPTPTDRAGPAAFQNRGNLLHRLAPAATAHAPSAARGGPDRTSPLPLPPGLWVAGEWGPMATFLR